MDQEETQTEQSVRELREAIVWDMKKDAYRVRPILANVQAILQLHPEWSGVLAFDTFTDNVIKLKDSPTRDWQTPFTPHSAWTDTDDARTAAWLSSRRDGLAVDVSPNVVHEAVAVVAEQCPVHPVRDWLSCLDWDGVERLPAFVDTYIKVRGDKIYATEAIKRWMISAIARVYAPGCQVHSMLVLEGKQGVGKSSFGRLLASEAWFSDSRIDIGSKDAFESLRGKWIVEMAELSDISKSELEAVKAFISSATDTYRKAYARSSTTVPRQCVFIGTTNEAQYLKDTTGNRRFWPVHIDRVDFAAIISDRQQLWAEAAYLWRGGHAWHPDTDELRKLFAIEAEARVQTDVWCGPIREWVESKVQKDPSFPLTAEKVLSECIGLPVDKRGNGDYQRVGRVLRQIGYSDVRQRKVNGVAMRVYSKPEYGQ